MTLALRPALRYLLSNRRHAAPQKDITGCVRALTRLLSVVVAGLLVWIRLGCALTAWISFSLVHPTDTRLGSGGRRACGSGAAVEEAGNRYPRGLTRVGVDAGQQVQRAWR